MYVIRIGVGEGESLFSLIEGGGYHRSTEPHTATFTNL